MSKSILGAPHPSKIVFSGRAHSCRFLNRKAIVGDALDIQLLLERIFVRRKPMFRILTLKAHLRLLEQVPLPGETVHFQNSEEDGRRRDLWQTRQKNIQVMSCSYQHCSRRSFPGVSAQHAKPMVTNLVRLVEDCVAAVAAMKKNGGETPICPTKYYQELASEGQPAIGYVQKCAVVLARAAKVKDLCEMDDATLVELHSCDSGCAQGMQKITGDPEKQLKNKAFLRLRLITLVEVVEQE
jgi:hypothetical protein